MRTIRCMGCRNDLVSRLFFFLQLALAFSSTTGFGRGPAWSSHGPEGGLINALVVDRRDSQTLYAGTS